MTFFFFFLAFQFLGGGQAPWAPPPPLDTRLSRYAILSQLVLVIVGLRDISCKFLVDVEAPAIAFPRPF